MIRTECKRNVFERIRKCCFIQDFRIEAKNWNFEIGTKKNLITGSKSNYKLTTCSFDKTCSPSSFDLCALNI